MWAGSTVRLGIVLLSPHSQALRPGHAAAVRLLGGFPLRRRLLYRGFPVATDQSCWDASAAQPRVKRKHPFLLLPLFLLSSYLTAKNNTYSACCILASLLLMPDSLFCPFCCCNGFPPSQRGDPDEYSPSVLRYLTFFLFFFFPSDCTNANDCNCVKQIVSILLLNDIFISLEGEIHKGHVMQHEATTVSRGKETSVATQRQQADRMQEAVRCPEWLRRKASHGRL